MLQHPSIWVLAHDRYLLHEAAQYFAVKSLGWILINPYGFVLEPLTFCVCISATDLSMACRMHTVIQPGIMGTAAATFLTHTFLGRLGMSSSVKVLFS